MEPRSHSNIEDGSVEWPGSHLFKTEIGVSTQNKTRGRDTVEGGSFYHTGHTGTLLWLCLCLRVYETFSTYYIHEDLLHNQEKAIH